MEAKANNLTCAGREYATSLSAGCNIGVAITFGLLAIVLLLTGLDVERRVDEQLLRKVDALFGVSTRVAIFLGCVLHAAVCAYLFIARDPLARFLFVLWAVSNCAIYWLGVWWLGGGVINPALTLVAHKLGIIPARMIGYWAVLLVGVVIAEFIHFWIERRHRKQLEDVTFREHWKKLREQENPQPFK